MNPRKSPKESEFITPDLEIITAVVRPEELVRTPLNHRRITPRRYLMSLVLFLGGALLASAVWCFAHRSILSHGECFVVLANRETVKMSMLDITVVDADEMQTRVKNMSAKAKLKISSLQSGIDQKLASIESLKITNEVQQSEYDKYESVERDSFGGAAKAEVEGSGYEEIRKGYLNIAAKCADGMANCSKTIKDARRSISTLESSITDDRWLLKYWESPEIYFRDKWDKEYFKTTTDSDGKFALKLKRGPHYGLVAYARRRSFDATEHYAWLIPIQDSPQIELNNNNVISQSVSDP
jgi:hypothetical protein